VSRTLQIRSEEDLRCRAEHQFTVFFLMFLVISTTAGLIAYWLDDYSVGSFVEFGALVGSGFGVAIFGRRAGFFRRGAQTPVRPSYRQLAMAFGVPAAVCGGAVLAVAASGNRKSMVFDGLNTFFIGVLFICLSRKAETVNDQQSAVSKNGSPTLVIEGGSENQTQSERRTPSLC